VLPTSDLDVEQTGLSMLNKSSSLAFPLVMLKSVRIVVSILVA